MSLMKYFAFVATGARATLSRRGDLIARASLYCVIQLIFWQLWRVVLEDLETPPFAPADLLWYLALTEWVLISMPMAHVGIERDVRSGDVAYRLLRPISYLGARLMEHTGEMFVRTAVLGTCGFTLTYTLAGGFPPKSAFFIALPVGVVACWIGTIFHHIIGIAAVWIGDVAPMHWLWQKLCFVLGGLILPLDIYPGWLRAFAEWTPPYAILYGTGRWALESSGSGVRTALALVLWGSVALLLLGITYWRALRLIGTQGG